MFQWISFFMFAASIIDMTGYVLANFKVRLYRLGIYTDIYRDDAIMGNVYALTASLVVATIVHTFERKVWRIVSVFIVLALTDIFILAEVLKVFIPLRMFHFIALGYSVVVVWLIAKVKRMFNCQNFGKTSQPRPNGRG
jgi:hypothetical protein